MATNPQLDSVLSDPDFVKMSPGDQRTVLSKVSGDSGFNNLPDGETLKFVSGARASIINNNPPPIAKPPDMIQKQEPDAFTITPQKGESFSDTMNRAAQAGKTVTPQQINSQALKGLNEAPTVLGSALGIGAAGPAMGVGAMSLAPYVGRQVAGAAKAIPQIAAMEGINYARKNLPGGKYIPPGAEWLPVVMGGKAGSAAKAESAAAGGAAAAKTATAAAEEGAAATAAETAPATETAGEEVPLGEPAKPTGNPYGVKTAPDMQMVDSTTMQKIGYNADNNHLWVEFRNGKVYRYKGVPQGVFDRLQESESQGSFLARNVKGRYAVEYMGDRLGRKY